MLPWYKEKIRGPNLEFEHLERFISFDYCVLLFLFQHIKRPTILMINHNIQRIGEQLSMASSREKQRDDDRYLITPFSLFHGLFHKFDRYFLVDHHDNLDKFRATDLRYRVCSFEPSHLFVSNCSRQITKLWTATSTFNSRVSNPNIAKSRSLPFSYHVTKMYPNKFDAF